MASVTGTGSKAESKGKAPGNTVGATKRLLAEQLRQSRALFNVQQPVRRVLGKQTLEALRTGGVGARTPIVQRAVEATNQAGSQALRRTEQGLAAQGLTGTPFGQSILAQQRQATRFAASQIPTQAAQALISAAGGGGGASPSLSVPQAFAPTGSGGAAAGLGAFLGNASGSKDSKNSQRRASV